MVCYLSMKAGNADDLLLATLKVAKPNACSTACDDARFSLRRAQEQERVAPEQDQDVIAKMDKLRNHLNGLTDKPQSLMEKLDSLGADQVQTYRQRQAAGETKRRCQQEATDAETRLQIAQADLKKVDQDLVELDAQIRNVQGY